MAQELSEKDLLKMEVEQLKKEVKNPRALVSFLFPSLPLPVPHGVGKDNGVVEGAGRALGLG